MPNAPEYSYEPSTLGGGLIKRQDADHKRTVALVDSRTQYQRFLLAITRGLPEVRAVHAIDSPEEIAGEPTP